MTDEGAPVAERRPHPSPETAARIASLAEAALGRQLDSSSETDQKAWQAFGAGSVVVGLGVAGHYGMRDVRDVDHVVVDTIAKGFNKNRMKLYVKAGLLMIAVIALAVETTSLALYVI